MDRIRLTGLAPEAMHALLQDLGEPAFRAKQLLDWVYAKRVDSFKAMRNIPKTLRARLEETTLLRSLEQIGRESSADGLTEKRLLQTPEGHTLETVLIREKERRTVCVSCALGCALGCLFCASGKGGLIRQLEPAEMVEQVLHVEDATGERVSNVVFMGAGEPFLNYDEVLDAARILNAPWGLGIGARHITVSTVGVVTGIERFAGEPEEFRLALSLHAPNQTAREKVIPSARKYRLPNILDALRRYTRETRREVTIEYILVEGFNCHPNDAAELVRLLDGIPCKINCIPYNPLPELDWQPPSVRTAHEFVGHLQAGGLRATLRAEKGREISAACGQLRARRAEAGAARET